MDNFENSENSGKKVNWLAIAIGGLVMFGAATVVVAVSTLKPVEESSEEIEEGFLEEGEGENWFVEPEEVSDSMGEDFGLSGFWSDYLEFDEIASVEKAITDYFSFAFPKFKEIKVEKMVRDGKELAEKAEEEGEEGEEAEEFSEAFSDEEEEVEDDDTIDDDNGSEEVLEKTRIYLVSDTGRKFYADVEAGKFGLIGVLIYTEKGQEVFRYEGENEFDAFDYSNDELVEEAFLEI